VTFLQSYNHSTSSYEEIAKIGIVQRYNDGKQQFIHHAFVAELLINYLSMETEQLKIAQDFVVKKVLLESEYRVINSFLDGLLTVSKLSNNVLKECGEKFNHQLNERKVQTDIEGPTALHIRAKEDNPNTNGLLLGSLNSEEFVNPLKEMLLALDYFEDTVWFNAAETNSSRALKKIWDWAETVTSTLRYGMLLSQDKNNKSAWQLAAVEGNIEVVDKLWVWDKEVNIHPGELHNKFILYYESEGKTAWHVTAKLGSVQLIGKVWGWAKEELSSPDLLKDELLLSRDKHGVKTWHQEARTGSEETLGKPWDWSKEL
jgi:hypothetical protein